jgi:uncharacterized protein YdcH (DUF465 family)
MDPTGKRNNQMIQVKRGTEVPPILSTKGMEETKKAITHFARTGKKEPFPFKIYGHEQVKKLLLKVFNNKCAYCETKFLAVYPGDVEHFRPKGEVIEKLPDPKTNKLKNKQLSEKGYYWLAAYWENLLLSCKLCNQEQTHELPGKKVMVQGKKNQFPLKPGMENKRLKKPATAKIKEQLALEEPFRLIIDPCVDNPENFLIYDEEALIKAKQDTGDDFLVADTSIRVYALQRMPLVQARKELLLDIQAQQQRILELHDLLDKEIKKKQNRSVPLQLYLESNLKKELAFLQDRYLGAERPYLGMARFVIGKFLNEHFGIVLK